jgi:hypothetical protein
MSPCSVDLYWIPVAAGTPWLQRASLRWWEWFEAMRCRRPRATLFHSALKIIDDRGRKSTLELAPAFLGDDPPPVATGPVAFRGADRIRLLRYHFRWMPVERLPDEAWAVGEPVHLTDNCLILNRIIELAPRLPRLVWGRHAPGTDEMWTSDSAISWLLECAGIDLSGVHPPPGGRAPGWYAGVAWAHRVAG